MDAMKRSLLVATAVGGLLVLSVPKGTGEARAAGVACGLSGGFRATYGRIAYDKGGGGVMPASTRQLVLSGSRWQYGSSSGTFSAVPIAPSDWTHWRASPSTASRKIVVSGWNGRTADGPLEGQGATVTAFWVIYRVAPPTVSASALIYLRFNHVGSTAQCRAPDSGGSASSGGLVLSPATVHRGGTVNAAASGFEVGERLMLTDEHGGTVDYLSGGNADAAGKLAFTLPTYSDTAIGKHLICAEGPSSHRKACAAFVVG